MSDRRWYVTIAGQELGPLSDAQLKAAAQQRKITPRTAVRKTGMSTKVPASKIRGLFDPSPSPTQETTEAVPTAMEVEEEEEIAVAPPAPEIATAVLVESEREPVKRRSRRERSEEPARVVPQALERVPGPVGEWLRGYYLRSAHVFYSLIFVLPMVVVYAIGLLQYGFSRNGAHGILRLVFAISAHFVGHALTNLIFLAAALAGIAWIVREIVRKPVKISLLTFPVMLVEAAVLGFLIEVLRSAALGLSLPSFFTFVPNPTVAQQMSIVLGIDSAWEDVHGSIGAGLCEEFVFRVLLIRLLYFAAEGRDMPFGTEPTALNSAILLSSFLFAAVHLPGLSKIHGGLFLLFDLVSLTFIGVLFAIIYLRRGFAIAAATHAFVDLYLGFGIIS